MKQSADGNFKFDENSRKFSKWLENTVGKEEIARYEQFLLFPQCFQKACFQGASKGVIVWECVNSLQHQRKMEAFLDDKINANKSVQFVSEFETKLLEKEKMLVTSILSFFHNVLKCLLSQGFFKTQGNDVMG